MPVKNRKVISIDNIDVKNLGIGNMSGFTNLSEKQKSFLLNLHIGFNSEIEYLQALYEIRRLNLGIPNNLYSDVMTKREFYVFLLNDNIIDDRAKYFYRLNLIKFLINEFANTLNEFRKRALEFNLIDLNKEKTHGKIGYAGVNNYD